MPDEKICPVAGSYLGCAIAHWMFHPNASALYWDIVEALKELKEDPLTGLRDHATQRLRAFFCLHGLFVLLRTRLGGPYHKLPLTREGIQHLIEFCSQARDTAEVELYATQLSSQPIVADLMKMNTETLIALTDTIVEAGEYLRPRLANKKSMAGMGKLYVKGLLAVHAPADSFVTHGRQLIHVSVENRGDLENV
jgi:hypothetical protein